MRARRTEIEELGGRLAFVGSGSVAQAADFRAQFAPDCDVYTDPKRHSYKAIGAKRSLIGASGPAVWRNGARARAAGFRQGATHGDAIQLGGVLVVMTDGAVAFQHLSEAAGDHPPVDDVIGALRRAVTKAAR